MKKEWPYTTMVHVCRKMSASVFMAVCTTTLETQTHQIVPSKFATGPRGASFEVGEGEGGGEWEGEMERGRGSKALNRLRKRDPARVYGYIYTLRLIGPIYGLDAW